MSAPRVPPAGSAGREVSCSQLSASPRAASEGAVEPLSPTMSAVPSGSATVNVLPDPGSLATVTAPPCRAGAGARAAVLHGGSVSVASEPGSGSTFTVALPLGTADVVGESGSTAPSEAARGEAESWERTTSRPVEPAAGTRGADILVVDDNADMRAYLIRLLGRHWTVRTTADGEEALAAVAERSPDIVLTDVMMPRVDGFELLRRLRADAATSDIPVIMLTARAGQEASVEGLEAGADDYLAKPFRADELIARVRVTLERAAGRSAAPTAERVLEARAAVPVTPAPIAEFAPAPPSHESAGPRPCAPSPRRQHESARDSPARYAEWRFPAEAASIPVLRRRLRTLLADGGVDDDQAYDLLLAACEAATNAFEHAQDPTEPFFDVTVHVDDDQVRISVRDYGQWRERMASMDRGRGGTLMSAFGEITATPSPEGTTVLIVSPLTDDRSAATA